jgi:hypothetical protein
MALLSEEIVSCPCCGEAIDVLIDPQDVGEQYIEDCQVCCKPIIFNVEVDYAGDVFVSVRDENET